MTGFGDRVCPEVTSDHEAMRVGPDPMLPAPFEEEETRTQTRRGTACEDTGGDGRLHAKEGGLARNQPAFTLTAASQPLRRQMESAISDGTAVAPSNSDHK